MKRGAQDGLDVAKQSADLDNEHSFLFLPQDMWTEIALYLTEQDLVSLQLVCFALNEHITNTDVLWQPLLNRLHAMDSNISADVPAGQSAREAFIKGFSLLQKRFKAEVASLRKNNTYNNISDEFPLLKSMSLAKSLSLAQMESLNAELDAFNVAIISTRIRCMKQYKMLDISWFITRIPEALFEDRKYQSFWQTLRRLYLENNDLQCLPEIIGNLPALERLDCSGNQLQDLPESLKSRFGEDWVNFTLTNQRKPELEPETEKPAKLTSAGWFPAFLRQRTQINPAVGEVRLPQPVVNRGTCAVL